MRLHLRLMILCTIAALAAGCSRSDQPKSDSVSGPALLAGGCATTIGDRMWFDVNCNGIQDKDESTGPAGVKVTLVDCISGLAVQGTATDGNGYYTFSNVPEGTYKVCFELPGGFGFSPKGQGTSAALNSDPNPDGCTDCFVLECDKPTSTKDAGLCEKKGEDEGCSPGFWKTHYTQWGPTGYSPGLVFDTVFGCTIFGNGTTLGEAIHIEKTHNQLAFQAVAALLNASHPDISFGLSVDDVKELTCDHDKQGLAAANIENCTLSGGNTVQDKQQ